MRPWTPLLALLLAGPAAAETRVLPRSAWGAAERHEGKPIILLYDKDTPPRRITLHHTDIPVPRDERDLAADWLNLSPEVRGKALAVSGVLAAEHLKQVQDLHFRRGWHDIGYHYMVDWMGRVYAGRPLGALGAHTESENEGNIGIALLGDLQHEKATFLQEQAVRRLVRDLSRRYKIRPSAVRAHRDYGKTDCPGNNFYGRLSQARTAMKAKEADLDPGSAVGELLRPWTPGRPSLADSRLGQSLFGGLLVR